MKEEIDWKKKFLKVKGSITNLKKPFRERSKELYEGNLYWIYVLEMEEVERI